MPCPRQAGKVFSPYLDWVTNQYPSPSWPVLYNSLVPATWLHFTHTSYVSSLNKFLMQCWSCQHYIKVLNCLWSFPALCLWWQIFRLTPGSVSMNSPLLLVSGNLHYTFFLFFLRFYLFTFREGERERNTNVWLPLTWPPLGTWPTIQACALTENRTGDPLVPRPCSIHCAMPARAPLYFLSL